MFDDKVPELNFYHLYTPLSESGAYLFFQVFKQLTAAVRVGHHIAKALQHVTLTDDFAETGLGGRIRTPPVLEIMPCKYTGRRSH